MIVQQYFSNQQTKYADYLDKTVLYSIMHHAMVKTQIYLTPEQLLSLKQLAVKQNTSYALLVRVAVDSFIKNSQNKEKTAFSWAEHARKVAVPMGGNVASRIDEILYG